MDKTQLEMIDRLRLHERNKLDYFEQLEIIDNEKVVTRDLIFDLFRQDVEFARDKVEKNEYNYFKVRNFFENKLQESIKLRDESMKLLYKSI